MQHDWIKAKLIPAKAAKDSDAFLINKSCQKTIYM